jgi:hypothetical protein
MKKTLLILSLAVCAAVTARANDLNLSQTQRGLAVSRKVNVQPRNEGAIQRGVRNGNILQLINPFAPREYGDGSDFVYFDENDISQHTPAGRPIGKGIKLFGFTF